MSDGKLKELHEDSVRETLSEVARRTGGDILVSIGESCLRRLLQEVFDLRWQNRQLQARGTELVTENRELKRKNKVLMEELRVWRNRG